MSIWYPKSVNSRINKDIAEFICNNYGKLTSNQLSEKFKIGRHSVDLVLRKNKIPTIRKTYTDEQIIKKALEYNKIRDFREFSNKEYQKAQKRGLLKSMTHFEPCGNLFKKFVYVYFLKNNKIYVGQTFSLKRRHTQHLQKWLKEEDIIYKKVSKILEVKRATRLEELLRLRYIKLGYNVLNKNRCTAVGGYLKWKTKEMCLSEALKYSNKFEWQKYSGSSYNAARRYGWLEFCSAHFPDRQTLMSKLVGKKVKSETTGKIYESCREAARDLLVNSSVISQAIKKGYLCKGQVLKYV